MLIVNLPARLQEQSAGVGGPGEGDVTPEETLSRNLRLAVSKDV